MRLCICSTMQPQSKKERCMVEWIHNLSVNNHCLYQSSSHHSIFAYLFFFMNMYFVIQTGRIILESQISKDTVVCCCWSGMKSYGLGSLIPKTQSITHLHAFRPQDHIFSFVLFSDNVQTGARQEAHCRHHSISHGSFWSPKAAVHWTLPSDRL